MTNGNKAIFLFIRFSLGLLIVIVVVYAAKQLAAVGYDFGYRMFTEPAVSSGEGREVPILIQDGMEDKEIAELLEQKGLIRDSKLFYLQMKVYDYSGKLIPGVYTLNTNMEPKELMIAMSTVTESDTEEPESTENQTEETENSETQAGENTGEN